MNTGNERRRITIFAAALPFLVFCVWCQCRAPLSSDDVWTLSATSQSWSGLLATLRGDVHPPFYFLLVKPWLALFGPGEAALQAFSALVFLTAIGFVWFFYPEGERTAAVLLLNPIGLLSSRLGRMYSLLLLLCVASLWAWRERRWFLLAVLNCLGTFTHIWFFFFLLAQGLTTLAFHRAILWRYTVFGLASILPYAVTWFPVLLAQLERSREAAAWLKPPVPADLANSLFLHVAFTLPALLWPRAWPAGEMLFFAAATLLIPFGLSYLKPVYYGRFTIPALLPVSLALARSIRPPMALLTLGIATAYSAYVWRNPPLCTSEWTAHYLRDHATPGDRIVFTSLSRAPIRFYWPAMPESFSFPRQIDAHPGYEPDYSRLQADLPQEAQTLLSQLKAQSTSGFWLLSGFSPQVESVLDQALAADYQLVQEFRCPAIECYFNRIRQYRRIPGR